MLLIPSFCFALEFGRSGNTYKIAERDFLEVVTERAKATDWNAMLQKEKERLQREVGNVSLELGVARFTNTRLVDLTTTLDHDIAYRLKDGTVKTLYPKGFVFNPLAHIESSDVFVILNGTRQAELDWFNAEYTDKLNVYPIVSKGNVLDISQKYKRPFTKLNQSFIDRFSIRATPTVFFQEGKFLRIDEIAVKDEN
jgi:conjugal transfer pilus assembly protein TraW